MDAEEKYNISETGNWNVAADYSRLKIMKHLYLADEYSNIAIFGTSTLVEDLENPFPKDYLMIKGFERLLQCLIMLIDNSLFAIKYEKHKEELEEYRKVLRSILDIIPALYTNISSRKNGNHIRLSRQRYVKVLDRVLDIKRKINEPLNKSHLIFTDKEEFDPVAFKERIKDRIVNQG